MKILINKDLKKLTTRNIKNIPTSYNNKISTKIYFHCCFFIKKEIYRRVRTKIWESLTIRTENTTLVDTFFYINENIN